MSEMFFFEQIVSIMRTPIWIYNKEASLTAKIGTAEKEWWLWLGYDQKKTQEALLKKNEYPVIYIGHHDYIAAIIYDCVSERIYVFGSAAVNVTDSYMGETHKKRKIEVSDSASGPAYCPFDMFISGCLLINWKITGNELMVSQLWEYNKNSFEKIKLIRKRISEDMFYRQENYGKHNPGEQELRELESIENGDEEALRESISETYEGTIGILAKTPLRHHKNVAIGNITLASRAAIRGG